MNSQNRDRYASLTDSLGNGCSSGAQFQTGAYCSRRSPQKYPFLGLPIFCDTDPDLVRNCSSTEGRMWRATSLDKLLKQLIDARSYGIVVGRENIVPAARLIVNDEAEVWRDVHGMLRNRGRVPNSICSGDFSLPDQSFTTRVIR